MVKVGDKLPSATFKHMDASGIQDVTVEELTAGKKVGKRLHTSCILHPTKVRRSRYVSTFAGGHLRCAGRVYTNMQVGLRSEHLVCGSEQARPVLVLQGPNGRAVAELLPRPSALSQVQN